MATVVNVPADERFASLGFALGARSRRKEEEKKEEERKKAFEAALESARNMSFSNESPNEAQIKELQENLILAGAEDQIGDFTSMITDFRAQRASQKTASAFAQAQPQGSVIRDSVQPETGVSELLDLARANKALQPTDREKGERKVKVFKDNQEKEIFIPKNIPEKDVDAFVEQSAPGFSRVKTDTGGEGRETEKERDVQAVLTLRGAEPTKENKAKARNLVNGRKQVNRMLAADFGGKVVEDAFGNIT
ncbi:MAG: hypothetical protein MI923_09560, partial [Phycisphaerales bacterium]|nr:hypothetical protein [Phycisphaerales bacterium]